MPTIKRIQPIVWMSTPLTVVFTAKASTAPTAARISPTPRPMLSSFWRGPGEERTKAGSRFGQFRFRLGSETDAQGLHRRALGACTDRGRGRDCCRDRADVAARGGLP